MADWIPSLSVAAQAGPAVVGGKGWNLGRLQRYGFPVPRGGVLTTEAYRCFMAQPELAVCQAAGTPEALRAAIRTAPLPTPVEEAIRAFLAESGLGTSRVAVRSSAAAEDGPEASFAGIHSSSLNVTGPDGVMTAVKECYASLWSPQAVAYRRRQGFPDEAVACAVVICEMVGGPGDEPLAAGVAFSGDPRTGRRDQVVVNAAPGLGEGVVSGRVNPEEITVDTSQVDVHVINRRGRLDMVLSDRQAEELARLTIRVLWALGDGERMQDVEWAYDGRQFWLLQARPVTGAPRVTYPAVGHLPIIWSNANLKDVVPGVPTTISWNMLQAALRVILYAAPLAGGYLVPPGMEVVRRIAGRGYFDLTNLQWACYDGLGLDPAAFNQIIGGAQPEIPVPSGSPFRGRAGWRRFCGRLRLMVTVSRDAGAYAAHIRRLAAEARRLRVLEFGKLSNDELLALLRQVGAAMVEFGPRYQLGNSSDVFMGPLVSLLERGLPGRGQALASALMAGGGHVVSAEHGYRVYGLVRAAAGDPEARAWLAAEPLDPTGWQHLAPTSPFRLALAAFLDEFGHRTVYELELANPRWNEDATYILEQVRALLGQEISGPPEEAAKAARRRAETEVDRLPLLTRLSVRRLAARCRQGAANREAGKSAIVAIWEPTRRTLLEVGRRMVDAGKLADQTDLFDLALADVVAYLLGEWDGTGAATIAADHRAQRQIWLAETPLDIVILDAKGRPASLPNTTVEHAAPAAKPAAGRPDGSLPGVAVAAGRATGRARIIRHPDEGYRLTPGEILVAPSTDPAWTPLFLRAGAVAMEVGGYLSHGAIVAREYGVPAVANVPGLLERLKDGQIVTVDGDAGLVIPEIDSSR